MLHKKPLTDIQDIGFYPITHLNAVVDDDGQTIGGAMAKLKYTLGFKAVDSLPEPSTDTMLKIYLVPLHDTSGTNAKEMFVTATEEDGDEVRFVWKAAGTTVLDLSNFYDQEEVDLKLSQKQDVIDDLSMIRYGASLGVTSIQQHQDLSAYALKTDIPTQISYFDNNVGYLTQQDVSNKVDKVDGKGLSEEDFTTGLKTKLESLENYDDSGLKDRVSSAEAAISANTASISANTESIQDEKVRAESEERFIRNTKQDRIDDIDEIREGAALGMTSIQQHQDLSSYALKTDLFSGSYNDLTDKPYIPSEYDDDQLRASIADISDKVDRKQNTITDLDEIRVGAYLGSTAIQEHQDLSAYALKVDVPDKVSELRNDAGYLTQHQDISGKVDKVDGKGLSEEDFTTTLKTKLESLENYDDSDIASRVGTVEDEVNTLTGTGDGSIKKIVDDEIVKVVAEAPEAFDTLKEISDWISGHSDDATEMNSAIQANTRAIEGKADKATTLAGYGITDAFSGSYNDLTDKPSIPGIPANVSAFVNDAGYLTEHQSLEGYATEDWVEGKGYLTQHQSLSAYALKTDIPNVPTNVSAFDNDAGYATEAWVAEQIDDIEVDLTDYAKKSDIPTIPENVSAFDNDAGYLTQHQDLSPYALKTDIPNVPTNVSSFANDAGYATEAWVAEQIAAAETGGQIDLSMYALKTDIPDKVSELRNDAGYLTQHQDISGKVDKVDGKGLSSNDYTDSDKEKLSGLSNYDDSNLKDRVSSAEESIENERTRALGMETMLSTTKQNVISDLDEIRVGAALGTTSIQEHQDLSAYALKTDIPNVPTKVSQLTNDLGFVDEQDVDHFVASVMPHDVSELNNDAGYVTATNVTNAIYDALDSDELKDVISNYLYVNSYAQLSSPSFTGTPTAPNPSSTADTRQVATCQWVNSKIGAIEHSLAINITTEDGVTWRADKTYAEINSAYTSGKYVYCVLDSVYIVPLSAKNNSTFAFSHIDGIYVDEVTINASNNVTKSEYQLVRVNDLNTLQVSINNLTARVEELESKQVTFTFDDTDNSLNISTQGT